MEEREAQMSAENITCPKCQHKFAVSEAMAGKLREEIGAEFAGREAAIRKDAEAAASRLVEAAKAGQAKAVEAAEERAREDARLEMSDLAAQVKATGDRLKAAQAQELDLRRQQREVEESKRTLELELSRKLDAERSRIKEEVGAQAAEEHRLQKDEWSKQRSDMERLIEDLRRKAEQGSQQGQGESFELSVESALKSAFPTDEVVPVEKGVSGADIALKVRLRGQAVGTIIFELKRTKSFSPGWLPKLRDDQRAAKADLAVLISTVLPDDVRHVGQVDGVWVASTSAFLGLTQALRASLVEIAQAKAAQEGRKEKAEEVFDYIHGVEFRGRVQALVEAFVSMKDGIEAERRAFEKIWSRRDKEVLRAMTAAAGMYGDLRGLGAPLQAIPQLALGEEVEA